ncbi:ATP-binding protein [Kitasatospora camelliae]|uniref:AAA family ATPase n=1 Tax=Kitasatospora camelliae TaxID=3156397 RepID=A0AAU8K1L1_9ACTN
MRTTSPFTVGRDSEIALLERAMTELRRRCGQALFLLGEAGIGKSRLVGDTLERAADLGLPVLRGRGSATGAGTPFRPLVEAVSSRFRTTGPPEDAELEPYRPALARIVPEWRRPGVQGHPENVVELAEALLRLLAVLGREGGCVLALEDLHDADSETVAVVEYLVDNLAGLPVLLVATLRPEPGEALDLVHAAERRRVATALRLGPLGAAEVRAIAAGCLGVGAGDVPEPVVERLAGGGGGNPYLVEELLAEMVGSGSLRPEGRGWALVGDPAATVPAAVVRHHVHRVDQLGREAGEFLLLAATLGDRFSASDVQLVSGHADRRLFALLRAAVDAGFVVPDQEEPGRYAFRHALTVEALLATVTPAERSALARQTAAALHRADPGLSDERCQLGARLLEAAGDRAGAARLYAEAGRQALAAGASGSAVQMLERGHELAAEADRTGIAESLLFALVEAGQLDRALALGDALPAAGKAALGADRRVALHTRLAWASVIAERGPETVAQVAAARALLPPDAEPAQLAALTVVEGYLALLPGQGGPPVDAERSARHAAEVAERSDLPVLACQAWQLLALLARERGFDDADGCLERMLAVAEAHALPVWRVEALVRLGANAFLRTGDARGLEQARDAARGVGAILLAQQTEGFLALHAVLGGRPAAAREIIDRCRDATARMRNLATHRYLLLTSATLAAHRGARREMERELLAFRRAGGEESILTPVMFGLCRAVCALLEEDRGRAEAELAAAGAWEEQHPSVFYLAGRYGLRPLLDVLAGRAGRPAYEAAAQAPAAALAWNRQFLRLTDAVLLGREGRAEEAADLVDAVRAAAALFPTGAHLGLRLVAEAALADGWGEPLVWLRAAEDHFHGIGAPSVAGACRALLRQEGASVGQRRSGRDRIPAGLRALGVTLREYEVFALLVERPGNQDIGRRLSISPRTVEKHIASLLRKTGLPDRVALGRLAAEYAH